MSVRNFKELFSLVTVLHIFLRVAAAMMIPVFAQNSSLAKKRTATEHSLLHAVTSIPDLLLWKRYVPLLGQVPDN